MSIRDSAVTAHPPRRRWRGESAKLWLLGALLLGSCGDPPEHLRINAQKRRVREIGIESFAPESAGRLPRAGVSVFRRLDIEPVVPATLGPDSASARFHLYLHRCGSCHVAPDPRLHDDRKWRYVLSRMEKNIADAGLLPLTEGDRRGILDFLSRHAAPAEGG